ncbi:MAG: ATP-binding cassette domain-containing protein [Acidimicrobiales bacterium]
MPGESVAIVGESGSGKSVGALSLLRLLPRSASIGGSAKFLGEDLIGMDPKRLRQIRGNEIAMIFQDPMTAFNPVFTIGDQIGEAIQVHNPTSPTARRRSEQRGCLNSSAFPRRPSG